MVDDGNEPQAGDNVALARNRRAAFRLPIALDLAVEVAPETRGSQSWKSGREGLLLETVTEDVSIGGLKFRAPERLERDTNVDLELDLEGARLELSAVVAQSNVDSFGASIGVRFTRSEGHPGQGQLSQFLFARERRRLPQVSVMYEVRCKSDRSEGLVEGTTEECSPGFAWLLLTRPTEPGRRVSVNVRVDKNELTMRGRAVSCAKISGLWRTGVEFDDVLPRWREVILERRQGRR